MDESARIISETTGSKESAKREEKWETDLSVMIHSPGNQYFKGNPRLRYTVSGEDTLDILLNGRPAAARNGGELSGCVNGFNTLTLTAARGAAKKSVAINFFVNKLGLKREDDFNRTSGTLIGGDWDYEDNSPDSDLMFIEDGRLVGRIPSKANDWANLQKRYNNKEIIQEMEIIDIRQPGEPYVFQFLFWSPVATASSDQSMVHSYLELSDNGQCKLYLKEFNITTGADYHIVPPTDYFPLDFTQPVKYVFHKNGNSYNVLLVDGQGTIIQKISAKNYTHHVHSRFLINGIGMSSSLDNEQDGVMIIADNYKCYQ